MICYTGMLTNVVIICYTSTELPKLLTVPQVGAPRSAPRTQRATQCATQRAA